MARRPSSCPAPFAPLNKCRPSVCAALCFAPVVFGSCAALNLDRTARLSPSQHTPQTTVDYNGWCRVTADAAVSQRRRWWKHGECALCVPGNNLVIGLVCLLIRQRAPFCAPAPACVAHLSTAVTREKQLLHVSVTLIKSYFCWFDAWWGA